METHGPDPFLVQAAVFLTAAVVAVPVFKRLGLGAVLGYLAAGALIGPHAAGLVRDDESVRHFAEFGVVFLLFVIGLELRPARLWRLRMEIFGLGLAQVVLTGALLAGSMWMLLPLGWPASVALGGALALSSTAYAIQILRDRAELTTPHGDRAFSILLFQDLAIVPLLALTALLAPDGGESPDPAWMQAAKAVGALAVVIGVGRYGLGPLFSVIARTRNEEVFTAAALLVVLGSALVMQMAGLSMALGAFLAGVLLAESEFRHQLETDIEPFRGLLLGLFFMAVGMGVVWPMVIEGWWIVLVGAAVLYAGKALFLFLLNWATGSGWRAATRIAGLLGQGGEFGFVILGVGTVGGLWDQSVATLIAAVVVLTMVMTPFALWIADALSRSRIDDTADLEDVTKLEKAGPVIVAGFGRFGQVVARVLKLRGYEVTLIDNSPERIRIAGTFGNRVFFGDMRRSDVLKTAAAGEARAIILAGDDPAGTLKSLEKLRARLPRTPIFCRAHDRFELLRLERAGATEAVRENFESAIELARLVLDALGDGAVAGETIDEFRRRDEVLLRLQAEHGAREGWEKMRERFSLDEER